VTGFEQRAPLIGPHPRGRRDFASLYCL